MKRLNGSRKRQWCIRACTTAARRQRVRALAMCLLLSLPLLAAGCSGTGEQPETETRTEPITMMEQSVSESEGQKSEPGGYIVDSVEEFERQYAVDSGLPNDLTGEQILDPAKAAVDVLHLAEGAVEKTEDIYVDGQLKGSDVTYRFSDGDAIIITMMNFYDRACLPQDWRLEDGSNDRTAMDLAGQCARGFEHENGVYRYPIFSKEMKDAFVKEQKRIGGGDLQWKIGYGSSPDIYRWTLVPEDEGSVRIVYATRDSGAPFHMSSETIHVGNEKGRFVVTSIDHVTECYFAEIDTAADFLWYFDNELRLPQYPETLLEYYIREKDEQHAWMEDADQAARAMYLLSKDTVLAGSDTKEDKAVLTYQFPKGGGELQINMAQNEKYPGIWMAEDWELKGEYDEELIDLVFDE